MTTRYENPQLQELLAAEYVMGNLQGQARRRLEKLMLEYPALQTQIAVWSEYFNHINNELEPQTPPTKVWENIAGAIELPHREKRPGTALWRNPGMLAATLLLAVIIGYNLPVYQPAQNVVVVMNEEAQPVWVIKKSVKSKRVQVKTIRSMKMPENEVCVLWLVWKDGETRSLGILSDDPGERTIRLPAEMQRQPEQAEIAVSIENMNSNMAQPRGKMVFKGPWIEL